MSKKFTYYGDFEASDLILDLFPDTEYFYSLNRGGANTTDVVEGEKSGAITENFTPEELEDGTFATFANGGEVRVRSLYNQGTVNRPFLQANFASMPNLGNPSLYTFNDKMYMSGVERNSELITSEMSSVLDKDSTLYIVFRSQSNVSGQSPFEEGVSSNRIGLFSDTRSSLFRHANYAPTGANNLLNFNSQQPTQTIRLLALRKTGNLIEAFDENGLVDSVTSSDGFAGNRPLRLFWQSVSPIFYFRGHLAVLMIREKSDTNTDLNTIINNSKAFYGI